MKKIFFIIPSLGKGGAEEIIVILANHFSAEHEITIILLQRLVEDEYNYLRLHKNVRVVSVYKSFFYTKAFHTKIVRLASYCITPFLAVYLYFKHSMFSADRIHINLTWGRLMAPWFKFISLIVRNSNLKIIETFHSNWNLLTKFQKLICALSWSAVDLVVCEIGNEEVANVKRHSFAKNVVFIPFAIERPPLPNCKLQKKILSSKNKLLFLSIARLVNSIKRFDLILEAIHYFAKTGVAFEYWICGDGQDREYIEGLVKKFELDEQVKLLGFVSNPEQYMYMSDIYIVTMVENFTGIAGLQAVLCKTAVLGINTVSDYKCEEEGIWSTTNTIELADKLSEMTCAATREKYIEETYLYVRDRFNIATFYQEYQKILG